MVEVTDLYEKLEILSNHPNLFFDRNIYETAMEVSAKIVRSQRDKYIRTFGHEFTPMTYEELQRTVIDVIRKQAIKGYGIFKRGVPYETIQEYVDSIGIIQAMLSLAFGKPPNFDEYISMKQVSP